MNLILGDCLEKLKDIPDNSIDSVITDPPYHLVSIVKRFGKEGSAPAQFGKDGAYARASAGFMGKTWDGGDIAFNPALWAEVFRVLKPGGHLLAFSGTRTYHRMGVAIEDAGFEIRDQIMWVYGSGFPKSHDISKAIDKQAGAEREVVGFDATKLRPNKEGFAKVTAMVGDRKGNAGHKDNGATITAPATEAAKEWEGWGTALKPAHEPICVARKPLSEKTVAENVLKWGTGAVNIDGCRVEFASEQDKELSHKNGLGPIERFKSSKAVYEGGKQSAGFEDPHSPLGRWPANFIHDGSDEVVSLFPETKSEGRFPKHSKGLGTHGIYGTSKERTNIERNLSDLGSAARFFYTAKTSKSERNTGGVENTHPTVKPKALMAYLCRLVTPPNGTVLDPFMGSGSTGLAALEEGFDFTGIEREKEYFEIAEKRIGSVLNKIKKLQDEALPL